MVNLIVLCSNNNNDNGNVIIAAIQHPQWNFNALVSFWYSNLANCNIQ